MKHKAVTIFTLALLLLIFCFFKEENSFLFLFLSIVFIYFLITAYGSSHIKANYFLRSVNKGNADAIAFTFDDGPDPETTPKLLRLLEDEKIKSAFFVIGKKAEKFPGLLIEMDKRGHIIANHSYSHSNFIGFFSKGKLLADIDKCSTVIAEAIGKKPLFFRPPFGVTNPRYASVINKLGLVSIGWTIKSSDTTINNKDKLLKTVTGSVKNGAILLFHDTKKITFETLPCLIKYCRENNIKIVSLPELIQQSPYEKV